MSVHVRTLQSLVYILPPCITTVFGTAHFHIPHVRIFIMSTLHTPPYHVSFFTHAPHIDAQFGSTKVTHRIFDIILFFRLATQHICLLPVHFIFSIHRLSYRTLHLESPVRARDVLRIYCIAPQFGPGKEGNTYGII